MIITGISLLAHSLLGDAREVGIVLKTGGRAGAITSTTVEATGRLGISTDMVAIPGPMATRWPSTIVTTPELLDVQLATAGSSVILPLTVIPSSPRFSRQVG